MKYSPITETDRSYVGENWTIKELRAISAILQVTKGVVAAGTSFFYKTFGKDIDEYHEILAMPRDFIMFRSYFEENGRTFEWQKEYRKLNKSQVKRLLDIVSLPISKIRNVTWPDDLKAVLPFYLEKYPIKVTKKNDSNKEQMTRFA